MLIEQNSKLIIMGDSISDVDRKRPIGEGKSIDLGNSYVALVDAMLKLQDPKGNIRIVNMAISGNTSDDLVHRWATDVLELEPNWVAVLIGINDVWRQFDSYLMKEHHISVQQYKNNLSCMIEKTMALQSAKGMIFISPYYIEANREDAMRKRMDEYREAAQEVAVHYKQTYIDIQQRIDEFLTFHYSSALSSDRVHPNQVGHMLIAQEFIKAISNRSQI